MERLSALIGCICDAALDTSRWLGFREQVARFVCGAAAGLLSKDVVRKIGDAYYRFRVDDRYIRLYREKYRHFNPLSPLFKFWRNEPMLAPVAPAASPAGSLAVCSAAPTGTSPQGGSKWPRN